MVLSTLIGFGVIFGAGEGIRNAQTKARREEHRSRKNNLVVHVPKSSNHSPILQGRRVVLSGDKLYIDTGHDNDAPFGHPFCGYYLPYPESRYPGLVSTITDVAPIMNWIFVDANTHEVKFGVRTASEGHLTGPWDCTRQDRRMTFLGWEGFVAVQEGSFWALYFDYDGDRLKSKGKQGAVVEVELLRKELKMEKPPPPDPETVKALLAQQEAQKAAREAQQAADGSTDEKKAMAAANTTKKTPEARAAEEAVIRQATEATARAKARADLDAQTAAASTAVNSLLPTETPTSTTTTTIPSSVGSPSPSPRTPKKRSRSQHQSSSFCSSPSLSISSATSASVPTSTSLAPKSLCARRHHSRAPPKEQEALVRAEQPRLARGDASRTHSRSSSQHNRPSGQARSKSRGRSGASNSASATISTAATVVRADDEPRPQMLQSGPQAKSRAGRQRPKPSPLELQKSKRGRARSKGSGNARVGTNVKGTIPVVVQPPVPLNPALTAQMAQMQKQSTGSKQTATPPSPTSSSKSMSVKAAGKRSAQAMPPAIRTSYVSPPTTAPAAFVVPALAPTSPDQPLVPPPRQFLTPKMPRALRKRLEKGAASASAPRANREKPPAANVREMVRRFRSEEETGSSDESNRPASMSSMEFETDYLVSPMSTKSAEQNGGNKEEENNKRSSQETGPKTSPRSHGR